jgi:hypothetical protein
MRARIALSAALAAALLATTVIAGFAGTDVFLPMAGRQAGVHPSNWYTTVWVHNPGAAAATARIYFLARGTANPAPPWVDVPVAPGDTEKLENVVEGYFHLAGFGALRVTCATQKLIVTSRVYSKAAVADETDSVGQDFAGVPASFAIGAGEKAQILGAYQTRPAADSEFRFNFGFVETTGHSATVRVAAYDDNGALLDAKELQVREWSQRQAAFKDWFPDVSTENARLEVEVVSGSGRVIAYGSGIANGSQDPTTFEMSYADSLLGIAGVAHDATLVGDGTEGSPLGIKPSPVANQVLVSVPIAGSESGESASAIFANAAEWRDPGTLGFGLAPGGVVFGNVSGGLGQDAAGLYWDGTSRRLGIGTATPHYQLELTGSLKLPWTAASGGALKSGALLIGDYTFLHGFGALDNAFVGPSAGNFSLTGGSNAGVGYGALNDLTSGSSNTAVGASSLAHNDVGYRNTAVGSGSLLANLGGSYNTALGASALNANVDGASNTAVGCNSLAANTSGEANTAAGSLSLHKNTTGTHNAAFGYTALSANTEGFGNVGVGAWALNKATTASTSTAVGYRALSNMTTAAANTAVGSYALENDAAGSSNTALGHSAMFRNTSGNANTAVGMNSLHDNLGGSHNTVVGAGGMYANASGAHNTAIGNSTLHDNATGERNSALGGGALFQNVSGSNNVALGYHAGYAAAGSGNVFLGYNAGAAETGSDRLYVANTTGTPLIYGQFDTRRVGIDTVGPTATFDVNGSLRVRGLASDGVYAVAADATGTLVLATPSDARLKRDIEPLGASRDVLAALARLRGVAFSWDTTQERVAAYGDRRQIGLVAQEVEAVLPEVVATAGDGYKSVDYARLTAFLVEIAKAQQSRIDALEAEVAALRK